MTRALYDLNQSSLLKQANDDVVGIPFDFNSQSTDVKTRKAMFIGKDISRIIWLGYSTGRCVSQWRRSDGCDPFEETDRLLVNSDPFDMCEISEDKYAVSFANGDIAFVDTCNGRVNEIGRRQQVHGDGNSRVLTLCDGKLISGSSSGSIIVMDIESGSKVKLGSDFSGVCSLAVLAGGTLLASGHEAGQLLVWDIRDPACSARPSAATPSKRSLDAITAVASHPAQSNLLSFGTDDGAVGFCDVRGAGAELLPQSFDVCSSTITQIVFHPQCGEHMVCSSTDGSIIHWDASHVNMGGFRASALSRTSVWTNDRLGDAVQLNSLRNKTFGGVYGFHIVAKNIVAAFDMMSIATFENVSFPISST